MASCRFPGGVGTGFGAAGCFMCAPIAPPLDRVCRGVCQIDANRAGQGGCPGWHVFCATVAVVCAAAGARPDTHNNEETSP